MFRDDPEFAAEYVNAVLEDGDQKELLLALRRIADAFGRNNEDRRRGGAQCNNLIFEYLSGVASECSNSGCRPPHLGAAYGTLRAPRAAAQ